MCMTLMLGVIYIVCIIYIYIYILWGSEFSTALALDVVIGSLEVLINGRTTRWLSDFLLGRRGCLKPQGGDAYNG